MATTVTIRVPLAGTGEEDRDRLEAAVAGALGIFSEVEAACTRFDPDSPLMRANRSPERFHAVPAVLFGAVAEAKAAYDATGGRMDPRVLDRLVALGYAQTLPFGQGPVRVPGRPVPRRGAPQAWRPRFRYGTGEVRLGPVPIDLGGIGKGLAVRLASESLARHAGAFLVEAGGDCYGAGRAGDGGPWLVGVEDPAGGPGPVAVLAVADRAVTTSSTRLRRWEAGGRPVHHLIDPRTGLPGGDGLASVTVVGADPARAEAWSKALFLAGRRQVARLAGRRGIAALWVDAEGGTGHSATLEGYLRWQR